MPAHYHIRWSSKEVLDWEAFDSREDAEASATQLVRSGETYTIVERDESCPRCWKDVAPKAPSPNPRRTYPWQQSVFDALYESDAQQRISKVNVAERTIAARLTDLTPTDLHERTAIREALRTLRSLLPEQARRDGESPQDNGDSRDGDEVKYPAWQWPLLDAFGETNPMQACVKIGKAQVAIKKRLLELSRTSTNGEEMRAIQEALRLLESLFSDVEQRKASA